MTAEYPTAIVLFQLGGPDSLEAIQPFLYNLFRDPDIINFPGAFLARKPLAKFISSRRSKSVAQHYREIGGKSPIVDLTMAQAAALEQEVNRSIPAKVFVAMRYWNPLTQETILHMKGQKFRKIVLLPLYPQFSKATTVSSMKEWNRQCRIHHYHDVATASVCCYYNHPLYIDAIVERVNEAFATFSDLHPHDVDFIFSAHGVPLSLINEGDPYQRQIEETVRLVCARGKWISPHYLCYQSKVGPAEWLKPSLNTMLRELAARGRRNVVVIPIAFVTEHIETLHEINMEAREKAHNLGFERFTMMPALNDSPTFIRCLTDVVLMKAADKPIGLDPCRILYRGDPSRNSLSLCPFWLDGMR